MKPSMKGRICLVTGATSGIGKETARALASMGATVVLVARDEAKGQATRDEIRKETGNDQIDLLLADLSSQRSIRRLAEDFKARYSQLHVLVNNAGMIYPERRVTEDGLEMTIAVNHLAYFLLTMLLLDVLEASAPARIVNVASEASRMGRIDFDDLQMERGFEPMKAYGQSKLANIMFTYELSRRLEGKGVTANCLHPGVVATGFGREARGFFRWLMKLGTPFMITPEKGARTSIYLASSEEVTGVSGKYFSKCRPIGSPALSHDRAACERLWSVSEQLTGLSAART